MNITIFYPKLPTVPEYVHEAIELCGWEGIILPKFSVTRGMIYPVITINPETYRWRLDNYPEPETNLQTLNMWHHWLPELEDKPPECPIEIVGLISDTMPISKALTDLWHIRALGSAMFIHTGVRGPQSMSFFECDIEEAWLVWACPNSNKSAQLLITGRTGPASDTRKSSLTRKCEEIIYGYTKNFPQLAILA